MKGSKPKGEMVRILKRFLCEHCQDFKNPSGCWVGNGKKGAKLEALESVQKQKDGAWTKEKKMLVEVS